MSPSPSTSSTPLHIALVSDCYLPDTGGIEVQTHDLARHLQAAGHEVVVVTTTPGPDAVEGVRVVRVTMPAAQRRVPLLPNKAPVVPSVFAEVARILADESVDVAHFHGGILSPLAFGGARDAQAVGLPTVVTTHCLWSYATPLFALMDRRWGWSRWPVVFSAVSDVAAEPVRRITGPDVDVVVLPNGIDVEYWAPPDGAADVDRGDVDRDVVTGSPGAKRTFSVVAVMRLAPRKRPFQLVRMLARVAAELEPDLQLAATIVGDGPLRRPLGWFVRRRGLATHIRLAGRLDRSTIRELFATTDAFVAPANLESFGIAALEARTAGVPVVAKARTGVREFIRHGREGLLATTDRNLADQLIRLARDPALRGVMAKHNAAVPPAMNWDEVVAANVATYRRAITLAGR